MSCWHTKIKILCKAQTTEKEQYTKKKKGFPLTFRYYSKFPLMPLSNLYLQKENVLVSYARCSCHRWPIFLQKKNIILCTVAKQCPFLTTRQGILKTSFLMKGRLVFLMKDWWWTLSEGGTEHEGQTLDLLVSGLWSSTGWE